MKNNIKATFAVLAVVLLAAFATTMTDWITQIKNKPIVDMREYNYKPLSPGGSLVIGNNTITLSPAPRGVAFNNGLLRMWVTGGSGTPESVPVVSSGPGTCTGDGTQSSCTLTITAAHTHSGSWNITSSHLGISEALAGNPGKKIWVPGGRYFLRDCLTLPPTTTVWMIGDGTDTAYNLGTILDFSLVTNSCGSAVQTTSGGSINTYTIQDLNLWGGQGTGVVSGAPTAGFLFTGSVRVTLSHVGASAFYYGVKTDAAFEVTIDGKSLFNYNICNGLLTNGIVNLLRVNDSYFDYNGRISGGGCGPGLYVVADNSPNQSTTVSFDGVESAGNGTAPFPLQTITFAPGMYIGNLVGFHMNNCYLEANVGGPGQVQYASGMTGIVEENNQYFPALASSTTAIAYAADTVNVISFGNTFYGSTIGRTFANTDLSTYKIGPDSCVAGSTECAAHPGLLGVGPATSQQALGNASTPLTTSNVDVPGLTLTLNRAGTYLISTSLQFVDAGDTGSVMVGQLMVNGVLQTTPFYAVWTSGGSGYSATASQTWRITVPTSGLVVKMQARKLTGSGASYVLGTSSTLTAEWVVQ